VNGEFAYKAIEDIVSLVLAVVIVVAC